MNAVRSKSTKLLSVLVLLPRAATNSFSRVIGAFVGAIERHALGE